MISNLLAWLIRGRTSTVGSFPHGALSPERLRFLLARERARSDRSGLPFSLVAFAIEHPQEDIAAIEDLIDLLVDRLRITDDVGLLDDHRVAALLPDTPLEGAETVADDVTRLCRETGLRITPTIHVYPGDEDSPTLGRSTRNWRTDAAHAKSRARCEEPARVVSMNRLFVHRIPFWKRAVDIVGAVVGLTLSAPLIGIGGLLIKFESPGPVFFTQYRDGLGGEPFLMVKMRTMEVDAEARKSELRSISEQDGPAFKLKHDPRVTKIGKLLRATSIDELPQFWNVLKGDMSLVGPRPLPCDESRGCDHWQRQRLDVTPGLTCIWQVEGRSRVAFADWIRMDLRYIRNRSFWYDMSLMLKTVPAVCGRKGAH